MASKPICRFPSQVNRVEWYPKTVSVDASPGDALTITSGYAKRATSTTPWILGFARSTWTNDTNNTPVPVEIDEFGKWEIDTDTALVQATHVGNAYDLTDQNSIALTATTYKVLTCLGITPEGRGLWRMNMHSGSVSHI